MLFRRIFLLVVLLLSVPQYVGAVLPPDIIFSVGAQFAQFFSLIALVAGGVIGSILVALRSHVLLIQTHGRFIIATVIILVCASITTFFIVQETQNRALYETQIQILNDQITALTRTITVQSTSTASDPMVVPPEVGWESLSDMRKVFNNDTLFLYSADAEDPFYLEIDMNRRQTPSGLFAHYYYLIGVLDGVDSHEYHFSYSSSTTPIPTEFIERIDRKPFSDLSTREEYSGTVLRNGTPLSFVVQNVQGDFLTKNSPAYTRIESVGSGLVTYKGKTFPVHALVEKLYSNDFSKYIFFPDSENVEAETRQFVLWDSEGNFYLIDQSAVTSDTPQYPSHTWLLHKNAKENYTQKSFTADVTAEFVLGQQEKRWSISTPDFDQATINLSLVKYIDDGDDQTRLRALVEGEIRDTTGTRSITGFVHIIK